MKRGIRLLSMTVCMILCTSCGMSEAKESTEQTVETVASASRDVFAMDTYMSLTAYGEKAEEALDAAEQEITRLENVLSATISDSEIYIANQNGSVVLSEDVGNLMESSLELYNSTKGAFDITIYPLMKEWGFVDKEYQIPEERRIQKLLKKVDASRIEYDSEKKFLSLPEGMEIDLGGIAKGYTSSRIMKIFEEYELVSGIVSLGGNVQLYKNKPDGSLFKVAIASPDDKEEYTGTLQIAGKAVITSGSYERYFEKNGQVWHHILNPETGMPARSGLTSVTIVSEDGTKADGLSTALFVMGKEKALEYWEQHQEEFDVVFVEEDGSVTITKGLEGAFSSEREFVIADKGGHS